MISFFMLKNERIKIIKIDTSPDWWGKRYI